MSDMLHPIGVIPSLSNPGAFPLHMIPSGYQSFEEVNLIDSPNIQSTEDIKLLNQHYMQQQRLEQQMKNNIIRQSGTSSGTEKPGFVVLKPKTQTFKRE
jgi:hypothetical protein